MNFKQAALICMVALSVTSCSLRANLEANKPIGQSAVLSQTARSSYAGVYVTSLPLTNPRNNLPDRIYAIPKLDGVVVRLVWQNIEPQPGQYHWSLLDAEIDRALRSGKKISIAVVAGAFTPQWLYGQGVPQNRFYISPGRTVLRCRAADFPSPWNSTYLAAYDRLMQALAAHVRAKGAESAVTMVKITGINQITPETRLPARSESAAVGDCTLSNGINLWQAAGYRPSKLIQAWQQLATSTSKAFPNQMLSMEILENNDFPPINEAGQQVKKTDPTYVDVKPQLIAWALQQFPGRFSVQWNGLTSDRIASTVINAGQRGAVIAWQTNAFLGFEGAGCRANEPLQATPCSAKEFAAILQHGLETGGQYLEVFPANALQYPDVIAQVHDAIHSQ